MSKSGVTYNGKAFSSSDFKKDLEAGLKSLFEEHLTEVKESVGHLRCPTHNEPPMIRGFKEAGEGLQLDFKVCCEELEMLVAEIQI